MSDPHAAPLKTFVLGLMVVGALTAVVATAQPTSTLDKIGVQLEAPAPPEPTPVYAEDPSFAKNRLAMGSRDQYVREQVLNNNPECRTSTSVPCNQARRAWEEFYDMLTTEAGSKKAAQEFVNDWRR